ncbi:MAG TPA: ABC transporter substrate-binding protein [Thermomicrobiaceae bacterium]|nr:ABC transporter substrate-binding protein [Thermomicrobiaceae bacterium]
MRKSLRDLSGMSLSRRELVKRSAAVAGAASVPSILAACGGSSSPNTSGGSGSGATPQGGSAASAGTPKKGGTLVVGMEAEVSSFDPAVMTGTSTFRPVSSLFDMLVNLFDQTSNIQPDLAETWTVSQDGTSVTMKLRPNLKFHDGTDVNADAVIFSFERMLNQKSPYYFGPYAFPAFFYPTYKSSTSTDPLTVRFDLTQPDATFLSALVWNTGSIVSPTAAKAAGKDFSSKPVGTGAFKFDSWDKNVKTTMSRFDGYWRGAPYLDQIIWKPIVEEAARFNQLASGEVDFIVSLDPQFVPQVQSNPNLQLLQGPSLHTWWVYLNTHEEHLKDKRVRQALNYAIDKDGLIKNVLKGTAIPSRCWCWPNTWAYEPNVTQYPYDPNKAKHLLAAAGYPNGFDLEYIVPESGSGMVAPKEIATAMQADLKKVGVNVNITTLEWISYLAATAKGLDDVNGKAYGMSQESWMNPVDDPGLWVEFESVSLPPGGGNVGYYTNPQYTDLLAKARTTVDQTQRATFYKQAQQLFADDAPWIFMFHSNFVTAARKNVHGITLNPDQNVVHLKDVWKS